VPEEVKFQTKPEIARDEIGQALASDSPRGVVLADAGYGTDTRFCEGLSELALPYLMGVLGTTSVWAPGKGPLPAKPRRGMGRPPKRLRRSPRHRPVSVRELGIGLGGKGLAPGELARGNPQEVAVARCGGAGPTRPSGRLARRAAPGAVTAGRMTAEGSRAHQVLAFEPAAGDRAQGAGAAGQAPLDRGAGLPGAQARSWGWDILRGSVGGAFIIMRPCALPPVASWWPQEAVLLPQARAGRLALAGAEMPADCRPRGSPQAGAAV